MRKYQKDIRFLFNYLNSQDRSLPKFLIAGTQKGGTTSLYAYLAQHPSIIPALKKEIHFFENPKIRAKGLRWYKSHFPTVLETESKQAVTGEATPFMHSYHVPRLVAEVMPKVKLIFLLRDPIDRALSHYEHNIRKAGRETLDFSEAIRKESERVLTDFQTAQANEWHDDILYRRYSYVSRGLYAQQLERWFKHFPKENFLILESESFYRDAQTLLSNITDFLDLPPYQFDLKNKHNVGGYSKKINDVDLELLRNVFERENEKLFKLIDKEFWKSEI